MKFCHFYRVKKINTKTPYSYLSSLVTASMSKNIFLEKISFHNYLIVFIFIFYVKEPIEGLNISRSNKNN